MKSGISPKEAKGLRGICKLKEDNSETKNHWIMVCEDGVHLCKQRHGEPATAKITISKREFNKLIEWYLKKQ